VHRQIGAEHPAGAFAQADAGLLAHQAAGAVAAHQVARAYPVVAVRSAHVHRGGRIVSRQRQRQHLVPAPHAAAEVPQPFVQHLLELSLRYGHDVQRALG
jgi:hypothetical protein